jgi:hypothetical protein
VHGLNTIRKEYYNTIKKMVKETPPKKSTPYPQNVEGID